MSTAACASCSVMFVAQVARQLYGPSAARTDSLGHARDVGRPARGDHDVGTRLGQRSAIAAPMPRPEPVTTADPTVEPEQVQDRQVRAPCSSH